MRPGTSSTSNVTTGQAALLDRRSSVVPPTPLDWMLRARIAESQGRPADALKFLKHIPDSDPVGSQAWLKAGQVELAGIIPGGPRRPSSARSNWIPTRSGVSRTGLPIRRSTPQRRVRCPVPRLADDAARLRARICLVPELLGIWDPNEGCRTLSRFVAFNPDDRWPRLALATNLPAGQQSRPGRDRPWSAAGFRRRRTSRCGRSSRSTPERSKPPPRSYMAGPPTMHDSMCFAVDWH